MQEVFMRISFTEFLRANCYNKIFEEVAEYVADNKQNLELDYLRLSSIGAVELLDLSILSVKVYDVTETHVACDVRVEVGLFVSDGNHRTGKSCEINRQLHVFTTHDLSDGLRGFSISRVQKNSLNISKYKELTDNLVPILRKEDFDEIATDILKHYYPQALEETCAVDVGVLIANMGLNVKKGRLSEQGNVFGKIFFNDDTTDFWVENEAWTEDSCSSFYVPSRENITAGTICIDPEVFFIRGVGSYNMTGAHESVHWVKHRKYFLLAQLCNKGMNKISCNTIDSPKYKRDNPIYWMEVQANAIAPKILMPLNSFKAKAEELIKHEYEICGTDSLISVMENVIRELADFFNVSQQAAKIRMVEIGYTEAQGALNYVDGRYVESHSTTRHILKRNQTYTVGVEDVFFAAMENSDFRKQLEHGCYVFVDNHLCLNDSKYIFYLFGRPTLTKYALTHMDECCVRFLLKPKISSDSADFLTNNSALLRNGDKYIQFESTFDSGPDDLNNYALAHKAYADDIDELMSDMPDRFNKAFARVVEWSDMSIEQISLNAGLGDKTVNRIKSGETTKPDLDTLVSLCIAMKLPPPVSMFLIHKAGHNLYSNTRCITLNTILLSCYNQPIEYANDLLRSQGHAELRAKKH